MYGYISYGISYILPQTLAMDDENYVNAQYALMLVIESIIGFSYSILLVDSVIFGRRLSMFLGYCILVMTFVIASTLEPDTLFLWLVSIGKGFNLGIFWLVYVYTAEYYPTLVRTTGLGFCACGARFAGIITPLVSTMLLEVALWLAYS
mmetsp:Transcript_19466/g.9051  ORF Transcript_19466/g.9051 Transcript_19466/m.9051 type:complete len:149 (+) Transcript_19466:25-471(+)